MKNKHLDFWQEDCTIDKFKSWCHKDTEWKNYVLQQILEVNSTSVLDIGCGTAHMGEKLKSISPKIKYVGTEITKKFVEYNKKNNFNCIENDMVVLPFQDNEFDTTICLDVLNHQIEYENKILEMLRVTKKKLIISFFKSWERQNRIVEKHKNLIYHHFSLQNYETFLRKNNLQYKFLDLNLAVNPKILIIEK
tara:strand:+ start:772 stop:1350 length:579 start_codon:yes stop_codon:yes gene_type:complete